MLRKELILLKRSVSPVRELIGGILREWANSLKKLRLKSISKTYDHIIQANDPQRTTAIWWWTCKTFTSATSTWKWTKWWRWWRSLPARWRQPRWSVAFGMNFDQIPLLHNQWGFYFCWPDASSSPSGWSHFSGEGAGFNAGNMNREKRWSMSLISGFLLVNRHRCRVLHTWCFFTTGLCRGRYVRFPGMGLSTTFDHHTLIRIIFGAYARNLFYPGFTDRFFFISIHDHCGQRLEQTGHQHIGPNGNDGIGGAGDRHDLIPVTRSIRFFNASRKSFSFRINPIKDSPSNQNHHGIGRVKLFRSIVIIPLSATLLIRVSSIM